MERVIEWSEYWSKNLESEVIQYFLLLNTMLAGLHGKWVVAWRLFKTGRMHHKTSKGPGPASNHPNTGSNQASSPGLEPLRS
jgi:hypothetical protein